MSRSGHLGGPVSEVLEAGLRTWVRRHGLVIWLDAENAYTAFVDRLMAQPAAERGYEVRAFRGSYLDLMLSLESLAGGVEKVPLVVHLPGFNDVSVKQTPLLELSESSKRYQKALDTLISEAAAGRARPERIAAFKEQKPLTLEGADTWLSALLDDQEGGLGSQLRALRPASLFDDLLGAGPLAAQLRLLSDEGPLWEHLGALIGLPASWRGLMLRATEFAPEEVAFCAASWALCVEYVDDLKRPPVSAHLQPIPAFPRGVVESCREIAAFLRDRHPAFYKRTADEAEGMLGDEVEAAQATDLGQIDTFRFEEQKVMQAALQALQDGAWDLAAEWAAQRTGGASFWLRDDVSRHASWELIGEAARLGQAMQQAGPELLAADHETALQRYTKAGAAVDRAHRDLEQLRVKQLYPQIPRFEELRDRLDEMRTRWRTWADGWARDFGALCRREGFLPPPSRQQRTLFEEVVRPLTQESGTTALFLIDALRFEMAEELYRELKDTPSSTVTLTPRLAELPTVTEVGMNVLAPVAQGGKLRPVMKDAAGPILGFQAGEYRVADLDTRIRAMQERVGGATCPRLTLDEVLSRDATSLRNGLSRAKLVVVHDQDIDSSGESGVGPAVFQRVMQKLRAGWRLLRDAGVRRFVITADHGFLLLDESQRVVQGHGRKIDPKRRHVFSPIAADHDGEVRVALADLGYEGVSGHLMFPETTAAFDTGKRASNFVHGGNSLQERVIPVLTLLHRAATGGSTLQYAVSAQACDPVAGMHCLEIRLDVAAQHALDFGSPREIELALQVPEVPGVQVDLCQTRGKARIVGASVMASVAERFELFFRLTGGADTRVRVELYHPGKAEEVTPCVPEARFEVTALRTAAPAPAGPAPDAPAAAPGGTKAAPAAAPVPAPAPAPAPSWLDELPEGGVRQVFAHLYAHGSVTEAEAAAMLGGPRGLRRFAVQFDEMARKAPFAVRILTIAGVKRFEREGS